MGLQDVRPPVIALPPLPSLADYKLASTLCFLHAAFDCIRQYGTEIHDLGWAWEVFLAAEARGREQHQH